jgi:hypothetical protein
MSTSRKARPQVQSLEGRMVLSHMAVAPQSLVAAIESAQSRPLRLHGTILGTSTSEFSNPDIGATFVLSAKGALAPFGRVTATGSAQGTGFIQTGRSDGSLTLSNSKGSVTLFLSGPKQPGFTGLPSSYQFVISGGTGAFRGATGMGIVRVKLGAHPTSTGGVERSTDSLSLTFRPT